MVITPGGPRPRSSVYLIEQGYLVQARKKVLLKVDSLTREVRNKIGKINTVHNKSRQSLRRSPALAKKRLQNVPISNQWIIFAGWSRTPGDPLTYFQTEWIVPPPPATKNGQLIYLFNGIENSGYNVILQPVLQWGVSPAGGGDYWAVANWYVGAPGSGKALHSPLVRVEPGDRLRGIIRMTGHSGSGFDYTSSFNGLPTDLTLQGIEELTWACETLECYQFAQFTDYPDTHKTVMSAIELKTAKGESSPVWTSYNVVTDNGQHCDIVNNASPGGETDLYYK